LADTSAARNQIKFVGGGPLTKLIALLLIGVFTAAGVAGSSGPVAQTQSELNATADGELRAAEAEMDSVLTSLRKKGVGHPDALAKLERAQVAWAAYRNAHVDALWPSKTPQFSYGSVHPMCVSGVIKELTKQRIAELRKMLKTEEGEVCFGAWPE
jgi:uncharacterized protein YecT (DUF1311 family)